MPKYLATLSAAAAAVGLIATPLMARDRTDGEQELAGLLEGRVPGEPENCIRMSGRKNLRIIDKTALVYEDGRRVWVNRTANPGSIDDDEVLIIRKFGTSSLCSTDTITLADRYTGFFSGVLFLEEFVPYEKTPG